MTYDIDWKKVDELLIAGCSGVEIAGYFGFHPDTLYDRCQLEHKSRFSEYSQLKRSKGDSILKAHQFAKALGITDKGDNTLLIWLGKTRLGQREETLNTNINHTIVAHNDLAIGSNIPSASLSNSSDQSFE